MLGKKTGSQQRSSFKEKLARIFRERELILRSEGTVSYTRVRSAPQMIAAGTTVAVAAWLIGANALAWWQEQRIEYKDAQIIEARVAYERLRTELSSYQDQLGAMADDILAQADGGGDVRGGLDLAELAAIASGIEGAFDQISRDLDVTEADRRRIIQSRDALHDRISALERELAAAENRVLALEGDVAYRDDRLDAERSTVASLSDSRDHWRNLAEGFEGDLHEARDTIAGLEGQLTQTVSALDEERARVADLNTIKQRLTDTVRSLEDGLSHSEARGEMLVANVSELTQAIQKIEENRLGLENERAQLRADLRALNSELNSQEATAQKNRERMDMLLLSVAELTENDVTLTPTGRTTLSNLEAEVGALMAELRSSRLQRADMEAAISEVVLGLAEVTGASRTSVSALENTEQKVEATRSLFGAVSEVQESQKDLILQFIDQAEANIARDEAVLSMAGLDIEQLLGKTGYPSGKGGPLEEVQLAVAGPHQDVLPVPESGGTADLNHDVGLLEDRLRKVSALNALMRCMPLISPVDIFQLTSKFGPRKDPITGQEAMHKGIDIGGWSGLRVHATAPGVVVRAESASGYGKLVIVDHGCGITTVYAHLREIKVQVGDKLDHRAVVGLLGSTGRSTGPHVHYEVRVDGEVTDPLKLIQAGRFVHKI